jgi:hypothetical protein
METTIYDKNGQPVAYVADDYSGTIYLWEGEPVAYIHEDVHVFGFNGRHLGWFKDEVLYGPDGKRVGFTTNSCPISISKSPRKGKRRQGGDVRPRWKAPASPKFALLLSDQSLEDFLKQGGGAALPVKEAKKPAKK